MSEGRRRDVLDAIAAAAGRDLLDLHHDPDHNRAVLTLVGEEAPRAITVRAVELLDLRAHEGVHPRRGVVDVVPFAPLGAATLADAVAARDRFAAWAASELDLPCFLYGPERPLPEVRRRAFVDLGPDFGPPRPHPTAGGCSVGARPVLVAYNLRLAEADLDAARRIARSVRGPAVRALGFPVTGAVQVSCNLLDPASIGPAEVADAVAAQAVLARAELVGLVPEAVLRSIPAHRWAELDLSPQRTIEARLAARG